ncbi:MAG: hypothetical protein HKP30_15235 [Myxococcales bacterium]|nr:hypothetical protein [Myxococcales bacterium]
MIRSLLLILGLCLVAPTAGATPPAPQLASLRVQAHVAAQATHRSAVQQTEAIRRPVDADRARETRRAQSARANPAGPQRP